jgi:hypothetical protein
MATESKRYAQRQPTSHSRTKQSTKEPPATPSRKKGFVGEFLMSIVAHIIAPLVLAVASAVWLFFVKDPSIPQWPFLIFVVLTIIFAYLSLISLQFFFHNDFVIPHRPNFHLAFLAILVVTVTAPLALTLSFTTVRINALSLKAQNAEKELESERQAQMAANSERLPLYRGMTGSMTNILSKQHIDSDDLNDILQYCIRSISLNKPQHQLRATVVYVDTTMKRLVVPARGYFGFDRDITGLNFDVSSRRPEDEDEEKYRERVGVAGWSYITGKSILDDDVQIAKTGDEHRYKPFDASGKDQDDRSMICVGIPALEGGKAKRFVGVLSISSPTADVFTENDLAIAGFFATLLGKFNTPVETPASVMEAERKSHEK